MLPIHVIKNKKAFSLFEVIVAMGLLLLLIGALTVVFQGSLGVYLNFDRGSSTYREARFVYNQMDLDLASRINGTDLFIANSSPTRFSFIKKDAETGEFFAIRFEHDTNTNQILRSELTTDSSTLPSDFSNADVDVIGENISGCVILYYDGEGSGILLDEASHSSTSWTEVEAPAAIKVTLTILDEDDLASEVVFNRILSLR